MSSDPYFADTIRCISVIAGRKALFWGRIGPTEEEQHNKIDVFDLLTRTWALRQQPTGDIPETRIDSALLVHKGMVYMHGGTFTSLFEDLHRLNPILLEWKHMRAIGAKILPIGLGGSMCVLKRTLLLTEGLMSSDLWKTSMDQMDNEGSVSWDLMETIGMKPPPSFNRTFTSIKESLALLCGGRAVHDLAFLFNLDTREWTLLLTSSRPWSFQSSVFVFCLEKPQVLLFDKKKENGIFFSLDSKGVLSIISALPLKLRQSQKPFSKQFPFGVENYLAVSVLIGHDTSLILLTKQSLNQPLAFLEWDTHQKLLKTCDTQKAHKFISPFGDSDAVYRELQKANSSDTARLFDVHSLDVSVNPNESHFVIQFEGMVMKFEKFETVEEVVGPAGAEIGLQFFSLTVPPRATSTTARIGFTVYRLNEEGSENIPDNAVITDLLVLHPCGKVFQKAVTVKISHPGVLSTDSSVALLYEPKEKGSFVSTWMPYGTERSTLML